MQKQGDEHRGKLGEMTTLELISSTRSELAGFREHLGMDGKGTAWDSMPWDEKFTRGYLISIDARLSMIELKLQVGE